MQCVLMAGGLGTRLRPFTNILPKPLVPIGDISIIELVLKQLSYYGFKEIIITVGYKAEIIMAVIGNGNQFNLNIRYHIEKEPLGTIGSLSCIERLEDNFLVMNGDVCTNMIFKDIFNAHINNNASATIGAYSRTEKIELGVIEIDNSRNYIIGFKEKPDYNFLVSMGVNVFNKSIIKSIPKKVYFGFDMLMHKMLEEGIRIKPYYFNGNWLDIGRPDDYDRFILEYNKNPGVYLPGGA